MTNKPKKSKNNAKKKSVSKPRVELVEGKEHTVDEILSGLEETKPAKSKFKAKKLGDNPIEELKKMLDLDEKDIKNLKSTMDRIVKEYVENNGVDGFNRSKSKNKEEGKAELIESIKQSDSVACVGIFKDEFKNSNEGAEGFSMSGISSREDGANMIKHMLELAFVMGKNIHFDVKAFIKDTYEL